MAEQPTRPRVSVIGAANLDMEMHLVDSWQSAVSNPVSCTERTGGVAANVAQQLAKTCETDLYTTLGDDAAGNRITRDLQAGNVFIRNLSHAHPTGIYVAVLEPNGELKAGLADTAGIESVGGQQLQHLNVQWPLQQAICFDCNCSENLISAITGKLILSDHGNNPDHHPADKPLIAALGVSPGKIRKLQAHTMQIDLLFANRSELVELSAMHGCDSLDALALAVHDAGIKRVVATDGANDIVVIDQGSTERLPVRSITIESGTTKPAGSYSNCRVNSVNGAGDALAGATLGALLSGVPLVTAVSEFGIVAARQRLLQ